MYTGKSGGNSERGLAHRVVTDLVMQLRDKETVVYIDNFFTSIPLLQELKESSINVVGTIRTNRKEYPKALQNKNLLKQMNRGDFHTVACETTVCTVWKDTKHVSFLSNVHSSHGNCTISRKLRRGENEILPCPPCAVDYRPVTRILYGGVLTRPKWTKLPKCIFYCLVGLFREVAIHEKL